MPWAGPCSSGSHVPALSPSPRSLPGSRENRAQLLRLYPLMHVIVDHHGGRQAAGAEAAGHFQREEPVSGRPAHVYPELLPAALQDLLPPAHVAGSAQADADQVTATGDSGEIRVESHHARHLAVGLAEIQRDPLEHDFRQIAEYALGDLQHGNEGTWFSLVLRERRVQALHELLFTGRLRARCLSFVHAVLPSSRTVLRAVPCLFRHMKGREALRYSFSHAPGNRDLAPVARGQASGNLGGADAPLPDTDAQP